MDNTTAISHISFGFDTVHLLIKRLDIAQWTAQFLPLTGFNFQRSQLFSQKTLHR